MFAKKKSRFLGDVPQNFEPGRRLPPSVSSSHDPSGIGIELGEGAYPGRTSRCATSAQ